MAKNPRIASVRAAARTTQNLKTLFNRLGNSAHPRGRVLAAYRNAHRALRDIARRHPKGGAAAGWEAQEVLASLRRDVRQTASSSTAQAVELGRIQGAAEIEAWGLQGAAGLIDTAPIIDAWAGVVESQSQQAVAVVASGGDWAYVIGDDKRQGAVRPSPVIDIGTKSLTMAAMLALSAMVDAPIADTGQAWGKQAIAAIDERTTDCCLQVAGQVVPFEGQFKLTGTPRYADEMDWTPFHLYCRTSVAMVPIELSDDDVTAKLEAAARRELELRQRASDRILEIVEELAKLGTTPNARSLLDDTKAISNLRDELKALRQRGGYPES